MGTTDRPREFVDVSELHSSWNRAGHLPVETLEDGWEALDVGRVEDLRFRALLSETAGEHGCPVESHHCLARACRSADTCRTVVASLDDELLRWVKEDHPTLDRGRQKALELARLKELREAETGAELLDRGDESLSAIFTLK